jgi:diacylglycerol kinase
MELVTMEQQPFSLRARARSFRYAWEGLKGLLATEHNSYIHLALTITVVLLGCVFRVSPLEAALIVFAIALVWMAELFNTAIEKTADLISKEKHPQIKLIKDVSAAAVLIAAIAAAVVGCIVFIPKIITL